MNHCHPHTTCETPMAAHQPNLVDVLGGAINLATTVLYGQARVLRSIVEGAVWHGECHDHIGCCCHHAHHVVHVKCVPETYDCRRCC